MITVDPNATLAALRRALTLGQWEAAANLAADLDTWLSRGGFPPTDWDHGRDEELDAAYDRGYRAGSESMIEGTDV